MAIARGTKASGGTDFVTGYVIVADEMNTDLNTIVSGVNNLTVADANVVAGANIDPSKVGDFSATSGEMQTQVDPFPASVISLATTLEEELSRIRFVLKTAFGTTYWYQQSVLGVSGFTTGDLKSTLKTSADTGWVMCNDGTIGNASSNGTARANADTAALFSLLWTNEDPTFAIFTSAGAASTKGADAATDYAANKAIRLPLMVGRALGVAGTPTAENITDSYQMTATGGTITTIIVNNEAFSPLDTDDFDNYTVKFSGNVTAALANDTATISAYNKGTFTFTISAVSDAPASGDTFTIYRTVATRALGAQIGIEELYLAGEPAGSPAGTAAGDAGGFANGTGHIGAHSPTWYGNVMVKL